MPIENYLLKSPVAKPETPKQVFSALGITDFEERDSDNYTDGSYFKGINKDAEFQLSAEEYEGFEEYPYMLSVDFNGDGNFLDQVLIKLLGTGFLPVKLPAGQDPAEYYSLDSLGNLQKSKK